MSLIRHVGPFYVLVSCGFGSEFEAASGDAPPSVLERLRTYDLIYANALTARGTVTKPPPWNAPYLPSVEQAWVIARSQDRIGLHQTALEHTLRYRTKDELPSNFDNVGIAYDGDGNMLMSLITDEVLSFEQDRSASMTTSTVFRVSPNGKVLSREASKSLIQDAAEASTLTVPINTTLWMLGRGYSRYVDEVTKVERTAELLRITASGTFDAQTEGRWVLMVDPKQQYLARSAEFYRGTSEQLPFIRVSNQAVKVVAECVYPTAGQCTVAGETSIYTVTDIELGTDQSVLENARRLTDDTTTVGTIINDYRVSPARSYVVEGSVVTHVDVGASKSRYVLFVIIINVIIVLVLLLLILLRTRRRLAGRIR